MVQSCKYQALDVHVDCVKLPHSFPNLLKTEFDFCRVALVLLAALVLTVEGVQVIGYYGPGTGISDLWQLGFGVPSLIEIILWNQPATVSDDLSFLIIGFTETSC